MDEGDTMLVLKALHVLLTIHAPPTEGCNELRAQLLARIREEPSVLCQVCKGRKEVPGALAHTSVPCLACNGGGRLTPNGRLLQENPHVEIYAGGQDADEDTGKTLNES